MGILLPGAPESNPGMMTSRARLPGIGASGHQPGACRRGNTHELTKPLSLLIAALSLSSVGALAADQAVIPNFAEEDKVPEPFQHGVPSRFQSMLPSVSDDGRCIAFQSISNNLVPNDTNTITDIFVHDAVTGETRMVSVSSSGEIGNDYSTNPSLSADGRYVAFESLASNFFEGDEPNTLDIFVHDFKSGKTELITRALDGNRQDRRAIKPRISADGNVVVFESNS